jgi:hypothetical protein
VRERVCVIVRVCELVAVAFAFAVPLVDVVCMCLCERERVDERIGERDAVCERDSVCERVDDGRGVGVCDCVCVDDGLRERFGVRVSVALGHAVRLFDVVGVCVCVSQLFGVVVGEPV